MTQGPQYGKIIFLDVDGVLNSTPFCSRIVISDGVIVSLPKDAPDGDLLPQFLDTTPGGNVENMRKVLVAVPDARIVISSDWAHRFNYYSTRRLLARVLGIKTERIIGHTKRRFNKSRREYEISRWYEERQDRVKRNEIVVIDDMSLGWLDFRDGWLNGRFVKTDDAKGFTSENAAEVINLLS